MRTRGLENGRWTGATRRAGLAVAGGALLLLLAAPVLADTLHVPADYPTIQAAYDAAQNGDTVQVAAGTYAESPYLYNKAVNLVGAGAGETTIDGGITYYLPAGPIRVEGVTFAPSSAPWTVVYVYGGSSAEFSGLTIDGGGGTGVYGYGCSSSSAGGSGGVEGGSTGGLSGSVGEQAGDTEGGTEQKGAGNQGNDTKIEGDLGGSGK